MFSFKICFASSTVFPTKLGIAISFALVAFATAIVPPKLIANNKNNPTIEDNTLCFLINFTNLLGFLSFTCELLGYLSSSIPNVEILCVG